MTELGISTGPRVERHSYTTMHTTAAEAFAEHGLYGAAVGAVEVAASMYARAFAVASVEPAIPALTPEVLATIVRRMVVQGESCHTIHVDGGRVELVESSDWSIIAGGPRPATWRYQCTTSGPHSTPTVYTGSPGVVHCRYSTNAHQPWIGLAPLTLAGTTGVLARNLEAALRWETQGAADGQVGSVVPLPQDASDPDKPDEDADPFGAIKTTLRRLCGRVGLVESTAGNYGDNRGSAPQDDWKARRIGPAPPATMAELREAVETTTLACCGIPVDLVRSGGTDREAYRRFLHLSVQPLAAVVATELRDKLDLPGLGITFGSLHAGDIAGKARAYQSLRKGGVEDAEARRMVGLDG